MDEHIRDTCPHHGTLTEELAGIRRDLREVLRRLGTGDVTLATLDTRLRITERIVYGTVALILAGVIGGGLALVLRP